MSIIASTCKFPESTVYETLNKLITKKNLLMESLNCNIEYKYIFISFFTKKRGKKLGMIHFLWNKSLHNKRKVKREGLKNHPRNKKTV